MTTLTFDECQDAKPMSDDSRLPGLKDISQNLGLGKPGIRLGTPPTGEIDGEIILCYILEFS
jgi:hypothetical protein